MHHDSLLRLTFTLTLIQPASIAAIHDLYKFLVQISITSLKKFSLDTSSIFVLITHYCCCCYCCYRRLYCTLSLLYFKIYSAIRRSSRKCVINSVFKFLGACVMGLRGGKNESPLQKSCANYTGFELRLADGHRTCEPCLQLLLKSLRCKHFDYDSTCDQLSTLSTSESLAKIKHSCRKLLTRPRLVLSARPRTCPTRTCKKTRFLGIRF